MRRLLGLIIWILVPGIALAQLFPNLGGQRTGTSAAQFLKIGVGARGVGMGESFVAVTNDAEALYWNPAGIVWFDKTGLLFAHNQWLVDTQLEYAGIVFHLNSANSVGAAITYLHTEEMEETTELQPFGTGRKFGFSDFLLSLTYARRMTSQFSFGVSAKFLQETIADLTMRSVLFDLGTFYDTGWKSIRFAVTVTNFGANMSPSGTVRRENLENETEEITSFQSFPPPILFRIGVAAELMHSEQHRLTGSVQLNHPNDNTENINIGLEYSWNERIAFRGGFKTAQVEENFSAGFGLHVPISLADFRLDYAFTNFGRLGTVNRFAIQLMF